MQTDERIIAQWLGRRVGDHRIESLLAQGGMGLIFQATPFENTGARTCVLKLLHAEYQQDPALCSRFLREGRILEPLQHPNIVTMTACREDPTLGPYMLMETLQGSTLKELTRARKQTYRPQKIIDWIQQICQALHFCHRQQVIHRDIKPANIFINAPGSQEEQVKLLDFGIAASPREPDAPGERVGTPRYMPPEQILRQPITGQADLYALGVVLFELLTRRLLFPETDSDVLKQAHLERIPPQLGEARPDLVYPEALEHLVHRMLAKDPADRPKSAALLYQELSTVFSEQNIQKKQGRLGIVVQSMDNLPAVFDADAPTPPSSASLPAINASQSNNPEHLTSHLLDFEEHTPTSQQAIARPAHTIPHTQAAFPPDAPAQTTPSWADLFDASSTAEGLSPFHGAATTGQQYPYPASSSSGNYQAPLASTPDNLHQAAPSATQWPSVTSGAYPQHPHMQQTPAPLDAFDPLAAFSDATVPKEEEETRGASQGVKTALLIFAIVCTLLVVFLIVR